MCRLTKNGSAYPKLVLESIEALVQPGDALARVSRVMDVSSLLDGLELDFGEVDFRDKIGQAATERRDPTVVAGSSFRHLFSPRNCARLPGHEAQ